jgi:hypothetical protein
VINGSIALYVAITAAVVATTACVLSVLSYLRTLRQVTKLRSIASMQGELLEIRDYLLKVDNWAKRINLREVMRERKEDGRINAQGRVTSSARASISKDDLRKQAGIIAGRPAPHRE